MYEKQFFFLITNEVNSLLNENESRNIITLSIILF